MKKSAKILSFILSVLMLFSVFSCATPVFAADVNEAVTQKEYTDKLLTEAVDTEKEQAEIVCEVEEKRDEYSKTYKRADGSYTAVISRTPLHTVKDGVWADIDNTLESEGEILKNAEGSYDIEFPETISSNEKITVTNKGESIAFSVNDIGSSSAVVTASEAENTDVIEEDLSKTVSEITYESVNENTDIQYVVASGFVKENIIVNSKSSVKDTYPFNIEKGNLTAVLDENNNLIFKNGENEIVFEIPAPVMTDADGAVSYGIDVTVENADKPVLTLTYTPSKEWLNSSNRAYPVVIDPVIALPSENDIIIEDTVIYYTSDNLNSLNTNYANSPFGIIADTGSENEFTKGNVLVKFNMEAFNGFKAPGIAVTDVNYMGSGNVMGGNILAKPINGAWDSTTITYDDVYPSDGSDPVITYENEITDYFTGIPSNTEAEEASTVYFNITGLFNQWLKGERENTGFALVPENSNVNSMIVMGGYVNAVNSNEKAYFDSYCTIDYVDTTGANDSFEYLTQEIGRAGTSSVNTFTRALSVNRSDLSMDGLRLPANVEFNYNSAFNSFIDIFFGIVNAEYGSNEVFCSPYGNNWMPSYLQYIVSLADNEYQFFTDEGTLVTFNQKEKTVTETEDGTESSSTVITFEPSETSDSGYTLELIDENGQVTFENMKLTSPGGNELYFNADGLVNRICEAESGTDGVCDEINIVSDEDNGLVIDYITDGSGRKYDFIYDGESGLLSEIKCITSEETQIKAGTTNADLKVTYGYDENGNLTSVTYPDGNSVTYAYSQENLVEVKNIDNYSIQYTYDNLGKVNTITEKSGTEQGNFITLEDLKNRQVKITDAYLGTQIQQFGKDGRLQYTFDEKGNFCKSEYAPANDENVYSFGDWQISSENLLKNGSFENASALNSSKAKYWNGYFERVEAPEPEKDSEGNITGFDNSYFGDYAYLISNENETTKYIYQKTDVENSGSYTLSAYVKCVTEGSLTFKITAKDASNNSDSVATRTVTNAEDWERVSLTYTPTPGFVPAEIKVEIGFENSNGSYYVDCVQLESGLGTADYNFVENGSFNNADENWSEADIVSENINGKSINAVKLTGGLPYYEQNGEAYELKDSVSAITQNVKINGKKGDIYSLGGWFKGLFDDNYINPDFIPSYANTNAQLTNSLAQLKVSYNYIQTVKDDDGNDIQETVTENFAINFAPHNNGWQYAEDSFALKGDVESVDVTVITKNIPTASFAAGIELSLNNSAVSFFENEAEETVTETNESEATEETAACPCESCEESDCSCRCESEEVCTCIQCKRQGYIETTSEDGKTELSKSFDGEKYMQSSATYSDDFNYVISETDSNNISSGYAYNNNGTLTGVTDGEGNSTTYAANAMGYVTLAESDVSGLTDNAVKMAISYVYNGDLLTTVNEGDVQYTYEYDSWGQLKKVSVDGEAIITYNYGNNIFRQQLTSIVFGNYDSGFTVEYTYNSSNDITEVEKYVLVDGERDTITYSYEYDNLGNLKSISDDGTGHKITYTNTGLVITDIAENQVIYEIEDAEIPEETEETGKQPVSITKETANGVLYTHNVYESSYDSLSGKTTECEAVSGGKTIGTQTVSDWFGRNEAVTVMTKDPTDESVTDFASITSQYGYVTTDNVTTNLVSFVTNTITGEEANTVNYSYAYDSNGRITNISTVSSVPNLSGASQYIYDEAGQLVKEIVGSASYEYAYDSKGNISSRKTYSNGTLTKTDTFTYGA
ncbi:MAG: hypothetical protein KIG53_00780, partial [Oscillospiraceae bacterium]|nr:hypothetical protein [Oscillospiraceae bacterium]